MTDFVKLPGDTFMMGSDCHYPEEAPARHATVEGLAVAAAPVTNAEFDLFVAATGHCTTAEQPLDAAEYPDVDHSLLAPGSLVFVAPPGPVDLRRATWWQYIPGACWRHPEGPGSNIRERLDHPVVHVSLLDAAAYASWAGFRLPTEAEWEYAARGGLNGCSYAWGEELHPDGKILANTWLGQFPNQRTRARYLTTPVGSYEANGYGLQDMIGNVWEWTTTPYRERRSAAPCCGVESGDRRLVLKGGSYLCSPQYCQRYRPAARVGQQPATSTAHTGFRCVASP